MNSLTMRLARVYPGEKSDLEMSGVSPITIATAIVSPKALPSPRKMLARLRLPPETRTGTGEHRQLQLEYAPRNGRPKIVVPTFNSATGAPCYTTGIAAIA